MKIESFEQFESTLIGRDFLNRVSNTENKKSYFGLPLNNYNKLLIFLDRLYENIDSFINTNITKSKEIIDDYRNLYQKYLIDLNQYELIRFNTLTSLIEIITKIELISDKLNKYKQEQSKLKEELKAFVQDKSIDLEERWEILFTSRKLFYNI
jgi:Na+/phosphate symporter